jgi:hypothetical protein
VENIIEERGFFWWSDEPVPGRCYAPDAHVVGVLTIDGSGGISLKLDGLMPGRDFGDSFGDGKVDKKIIGRLKNREHVFLDELFIGASSYGDISHESYISQKCLISKQPFSVGDSIKIKELQISLKSLNDWFGLRPISDDSVDNRYPDQLTIKYQRPEPSTYQLDDGLIKIEHHYDASNRGGLSFNIEVYSQFHYVSNIELPISEAIEVYLRFSELMLLLTNKNNELDWPVVCGDVKSTLYFSRPESRVEKLGWTDCWVLFNQVKEDLGRLFEGWTKGRAEFQSAYYSYISTRKITKMYAEHQFASLVWGLESFHRKKYPNKKNDAFSEKISRITASIQNGDLKSCDKNWAKGKIQNSDELSLAQRVTDLILELNLGFCEGLIKSFAEECALYRNGTFHYGEKHPKKADVSEQDYFVKLLDINNALSLFYHAILLKEIGLPSEKISHIILHGTKSGTNQHIFESVGLRSAKNC